MRFLGPPGLGELRALRVSGPTAREVDSQSIRLSGLWSYAASTAQIRQLVFLLSGIENPG